MFNSFWKQAMRSCCLFIFFLLITWLQILGGEMGASGQEIKPLKPDDVLIGPNCMRVPLGSILLVRKEQQYCAIKFTKFWTGETKDDEYATYESYYQGDKTGDFTNKNEKFKLGKLFRPRLRGIGRCAFSFGTTDIECGPIKLFWSGEGCVIFSAAVEKYESSTPC